MRYDQLMDLGWKVLIEAAFLWAMVTAVIVIAQDQQAGTFDILLTAGAAAIGAVLIYGILMLCVPKRDEIEEIR
jgi:NADH-quinone oxidoreductase subunit H